MSSLGVVAGSGAAFVNLNPEVLCSDNNQVNISMNVTDGVPALDMDDGNNTVSVYMDANGALNLTDNVMVDQSGSLVTPYISIDASGIAYENWSIDASGAINTPYVTIDASGISTAAWSIDASGNVSGNFVLPPAPGSDLSTPNDADFNDVFNSVQNIMENDNANNEFFDWVVGLQTNPTEYENNVALLESAYAAFNDSLISDYPELESQSFMARIIVALNDGSVYYDSDLSNNWYNAVTHNMGLSLNLRPSVMSVQTNDFDFTFETQTAFEYDAGNDSTTAIKHFYVATKISNSNNPNESNGDLGNNYGTVVYSFRIDDPTYNLANVRASANRRVSQKLSNKKAKYSDAWLTNILTKKVVKAIVKNMPKKVNNKKVVENKKALNKNAPNKKALNKNAPNKKALNKKAENKKPDNKKKVTLFQSKTSE